MTRDNPHSDPTNDADDVLRYCSQRSTLIDDAIYSGWFTIVFMYKLLK